MHSRSIETCTGNIRLKTSVRCITRQAISVLAMAEGVTAEDVTILADKVVTGAGDTGDAAQALSPVILVIVGEPIDHQYVQLLLDRVVTGKTHLCSQVEIYFEHRHSASYKFSVF